MTPIPSSFQSHGFSFSQISRAGQIALFLKDKPRWLNHDHFEVVIIQLAQKSVCPSGSIVLPHECFPHSNSWGTLGWSFVSLSEAKTKFNALIECHRIASTSSVESTFTPKEGKDSALTHKTPAITLSVADLSPEFDWNTA